MSKYSKPELETQVNELNAQILAGLTEIGLIAELRQLAERFKNSAKASPL